MAQELSELQQRMYDLLNSPADTDVAIYKLYEAAYQTNVHKFAPDKSLILGMPIRTMQMRLGSAIARINEKLELDKSRVVPGKLKQTYRLDTGAA